MADVLHVCVLLVILYFGAEAGVLSGKGLYCRDPDTGKLYAVNETWPSTTFCGNYTCKLKKKNITEMEYSPSVRIYNVTSVPNQVNMNNYRINNITETNRNSNPLTIEKRPYDHREIPDRQSILQINSKTSKTSVDNDRYLTESEIKSITEMLHTVKKSDLEAIVEIYNLAQDIYKEMDKAPETSVQVKNKATLETLNRETMITGKTNDIKSEQITPVKNKHKSYWYEPLHFHNDKGKSSLDMNQETSNLIPSTNKPKNVYSSNYFNEPLSGADFGKLPYYYPVSSFHRVSSYVHHKPNHNVPRTTSNAAKPPCSRAIARNFVAVSPWYSKNVKKPLESQRFIQPMLPYPFSYVAHYNSSSYPNNFFYNRYPWSVLKVNNDQRSYLNNYIPKTAVVLTPEVIEENQNVEQETGGDKNLLESLLSVAKSSGETKSLAPWQTNPLSNDVLDDVKANIIEKAKMLKTLPRINKVKLEKVGKVIKLDELVRSKREVLIKENEETQYETYIERKTCELEKNTEPGLFRVGNMSQPFPGCCPQRIDKR